MWNLWILEVYHIPLGSIESCCRLMGRVVYLTSCRVYLSFCVFRLVSKEHTHTHKYTSWSRRTLGTEVHIWTRPQRQYCCRKTVLLMFKTKRHTPKPHIIQLFTWKISYVSNIKVRHTIRQISEVANYKYFVTVLKLIRVTLKQVVLMATFDLLIRALTSFNLSEKV